jgi:hypothetical protein
MIINLTLKLHLTCGHPSRDWHIRRIMEWRFVVMSHERNCSCTREYLKLKCPGAGCNQELTLSCPFCLDGDICDSRGNGYLTCDQCHQTLTGINCTCEHTLTARYIHEKRQRLLTLQKDADPANYLAIVKTFAFVTLLVWIATSISG